MHLELEHLPDLSTSLASVGKRRVIAFLCGAVKPKRIVEIGMVRTFNDPHDGHSTLAWARWAQGTGTSFTSVDVSGEAIKVCSEMLTRSGLRAVVELICEDGEAFLKCCDGPTIDILYLDGADEPEPTLAQFRAAEHALHAESIVVLDDTQSYHGNALGKGTLLIPHMIQHGWQHHYLDVGEGWNMSILQREGGPTSPPLQPPTTTTVLP